MLSVYGKRLRLRREIAVDEVGFMWMVFLVLVREYIEVLDVVKVLGVNVRFLFRVSGFGFLEV